MQLKQQVHKIQDFQRIEDKQEVFGANSNLRDLFNLLLKIDMRDSPEYYTKLKNKKRNEKSFSAFPK